MYKTVLARVLDASAIYNPDAYSIIELVKLPRDSVRVFKGYLTKEQFDELKEHAAFVLLEQDQHSGQLPTITRVIKPAYVSGFQRCV